MVYYHFKENHQVHSYMVSQRFWTTLTESIPLMKDWSKNVFI